MDTKKWTNGHVRVHVAPLKRLTFQSVVKSKMSNSELPELLTGTESRQLAGMPAVTWLELLETGQLPKPVRVGGRFKWRRADILQWVRELKQRDVFA